MQKYNLGLDINMCGGKPHWDFSSGVKWDDAVHASLYAGFNVVKKQLAFGRRCGRGFYEVGAGGGVGVRASRTCAEDKLRFICLDPKKPEASALTGESGGLFSNFGLTVVCGILATAVLVLTCVSVKSYRTIRKLRKEKEISEECNV